MTVRRMVLAVIACVLAITASGDRPPDSESIGPARELTPAEGDVVRYAEEILLSRCMAERGHRYAALPPRAQDDHQVPAYVIDDPAWAAAHGLGSDIQREVLRAKEVNPNEQHFRQLSPAQQRAHGAALHGTRPGAIAVRLPQGGVLSTSDDGCLSEVKDTLYGDLETWFAANAVVTNLRPLVLRAVRADPRYQRAVADWSSCMRGAGHDYADPDALRAGFRQRPERHREISLATAEAHCAVHSGLGVVVRELDRHHTDAVRGAFREQVETRDRLRLAALVRARHITDQHDNGEGKRP